MVVILQYMNYMNKIVGSQKTSTHFNKTLVRRDSRTRFFTRTVSCSVVRSVISSWTNFYLNRAMKQYILYSAHLGLVECRRVDLVHRLCVSAMCRLIETSTRTFTRRDEVKFTWAHTAVVCVSISSESSKHRVSSLPCASTIGTTASP